MVIDSSRAWKDLIGHGASPLLKRWLSPRTIRGVQNGLSDSGTSGSAMDDDSIVLVQRVIKIQVSLVERWTIPPLTTPIAGRYLFVLNDWGTRMECVHQWLLCSVETMRCSMGGFTHVPEPSKAVFHKFRGQISRWLKSVNFQCFATNTPFASFFHKFSLLRQSQSRLLPKRKACTLFGLAPFYTILSICSCTSNQRIIRTVW